MRWWQSFIACPHSYMHTRCRWGNPSVRLSVRQTLPWYCVKTTKRIVEWKLRDFRTITRWISKRCETEVQLQWSSILKSYVSISNRTVRFPMIEDKADRSGVYMEDCSSSTLRAAFNSLINSSVASAPTQMQTRNMGQSPTRGARRPQVRLEMQFWGL